jgi:hypothetical protein
VTRSCIVVLGWAAAVSACSAQDPAILQIKIVEGEGAVYAGGSRSTRGVTVQVTDETGKPVDGATVSFRLPEAGAGGTFSGGTKTEIVTTRGDGRAAVWGMQWNRTEGPFEVRITAVKGSARAGTVCALYLTNAVTARDQAAPAGRTGLSRGHKWVWIALAVVGGAGGAVAAAGLAGKSQSAGSGVVTLHIGGPTGVNLGRP